MSAGTLVERRSGAERRHNGKGPLLVTVPRAQLVDHHIDDQLAWHDVADVAEKIAAYARAKQRKAWERVKAWDPPE